MNPRPPRATLFPYTTLFRSAHRDAASRAFGNYALQALAKLGLGLRRAARERVEHQRAAAQAQAHQEVPGEGHAFERQPDAPAELHIEDRKADRSAGLAVDHLVQVAVARIVIVVGIAPVAEVIEEELVERHHLFLRGVGLRHARAQAYRHAL